ncbi:MAG: DUF5696 domain-containing protein [Kiritimatiellia bacterium]
MKKLTFGDDRLTCVLSKDREIPRLEITSTVHHCRRGPAPLLEAELFNNTVRRPEFCRRLELLDARAGESSAKVDVAIPNRRIEFTLELRVENGELAVGLDIPSVREMEPELFRLFGVEILPGLLTASGDGAVLLPLNCGVLCRAHGKPKLEDRFLLYGEQPRWQLMPILPVAACFDRGGSMMLLSTAAIADTLCSVRTDGEGKAEVAFGFSLRRDWPDPVDSARREIRLIPIPAGGDPLRPVAERLRRHVMDDLGKKRLTERIKESPALAHVTNGYIIKLFHAMLTRGALQGSYDSKPPDLRYEAYLTFDEAIECLRKLHSAGLRNITTQSVGWYPDGHDAMFPTRFPIDERIGGESGFRRLIAAGGDMGYHICVHDNFHNAYETSPDFSWATTIHGKYGQPLAKNLLGGGITRMQWPLAYREGAVTDHLRRLRRMGVRGVVFCDGLGNPAEVNYHPVHGGPRGDFVRGMERVMKDVKSVFGTVQSETAFMWAALSCDISNHDGVGLKDTLGEDWPLSRMIDEPVQLFKLAFHGLTMTENMGVNWPDTMRCLLYAELPRWEFTLRPSRVVGVFTERALKRVAARYELCVQRYGHLKTLFMTKWERLAEDVERTTYEDGTEITADFKREELFVNGKPVERIG